MGDSYGLLRSAAQGLCAEPGPQAVQGLCAEHGAQAMCEVPGASAEPGPPATCEVPGLQAEQGARVSLVSASSIYSTPPWGVVDQPAFLNAVMIVDTQLSPEELLALCQSLERDAHRVRNQHWGPRTLDIDIVDIEGYTSSDPHLLVPHPYAPQRAFVLIPWLQADSTATLSRVPVRELIAALPQDDCAGVVDTGKPLLGGGCG